MMMRIFTFLLLIPFCLSAQTMQTRWIDLFSYRKVIDIKQIDSLLYCASENGIFVVDPEDTTKVEKFSKANLLSDVGISSMDYNKESHVLLIGYESGSLDILREGKPKFILDIPWNSFQGSKAVKDISIYDDKAMITGDFGIASFSLNDEEFIETTFFNRLNINEFARSSAVLGEDLYVATSEGVYHSKLVNGVNYPNVLDARWKKIVSGSNFHKMVVFQDVVYVSDGNSLKKIEGGQLSQVHTMAGTILDFESNQDVLSITYEGGVVFYQGESFTSKTFSLENDTYLSGIFHNDKYYGGSNKNGLIDFSSNQNVPEDEKIGIYPEGPYTNRSWSVTALNTKIWVSPGGMESYNAPLNNEEGMSYFNGENWIHFDSKKDLNGAMDIVHVAVNPNNNQNFFISSWHQLASDFKTPLGGLEVNIVDGENSVEDLKDNFEQLYRIGGATYDEEENLYVTSSFVGVKDNVINLYKRKGKKGPWKKVQIVNQAETEKISAGKPTLDEENVYIPGARLGGLIIVPQKKIDPSNEKDEKLKTTRIGVNEGLPSSNVLALGLDNSGTLWIGTDRGLRTLYKHGNEVYSAEPIVIEQNGIYEALLTDVRINTIKVDQSNRKWVGTLSSGAFYFSDTGEETVLQFNKKNSALPSDIIYDIDVDPATGYVYFATEKGVVAYRGDVGTASGKFENSYAYPNPVRPGFRGRVTIKGLPNRASVKITDVAGNLIYQTNASGGIAEWDTKNMKGKEVASGVYLVLMSNQDGTETKTLKIAVIR